MDLTPEPHNRYNSGAVLVEAPPLASLPVELHNEVTKTSSPQQKVKDVAGCTIGRVPGRVCGLISEGIRKGWVVKGVAIYTGDFTHGGSVRGGGPQLDCLYLMIVKKDKLNAFAKPLQKRAGRVIRL